jgi:hypothetical protein
LENLILNKINESWMKVAIFMNIVGSVNVCVIDMFGRGLNSYIYDI